MKTLYYENEIYQAERIVKLLDSITGYTAGEEIFAFRGIKDFSPYSLAISQQWDLPELTETQILGQIITDLELKILIMEAAANV